MAPRGIDPKVAERTDGCLTGIGIIIVLILITIIPYCKFS